MENKLLAGRAIGSFPIFRGKKMNALLAGTVTFTFASMIGILTLSGEASATAFLLDPAKPGAPAFGRTLWGINPVPDPGPDGIAGTADDGRSVVTLRFAFQSSAPDVNFKWHDPGPDGKLDTADDGPTIVKKNTTFSEDQKKLVRAAADTWNAAAITSTTAGKAVNNVIGVDLKGNFDPQTIALHEFGHALGLGHPNSGPGKYTNASNNFNVELPPGIPNPFISPATVDSTTLKASNVVAGGLPAARPLPVGTRGTEAVMVQGSITDEWNRELQFDDMQGLRALQSGQDFIENNADDFVFFFTEVGENDAREINLINLNLAGIGAGLTRSILDGKPSPGVNSVREYLDIGRDPYGEFSITTSLTDVWFASTDPNDPGPAGFADIFITTPIPEPQTFALLFIGIIGSIAMARKKFRR